jgi:hypothetical protein
MTTTLKLDSKKNAERNFRTQALRRGLHDFTPRTDTAFDIETGPIRNDAEDSLLDPQAARVLAIGYYEVGPNLCYIASPDVSEVVQLRQFWQVFAGLHATGSKLLGFNTCGFDLPFLIRRSWHHGVTVPRHLLSGGKYWCDTIVDLMVTWKCGGYRDFISLDALAKFLDCGAKNGNGAQFYQLWKSDRNAATEYLRNDVQLVIDCARKMGIIQ